jgi:diguanylate cyclase (GGDEF)-like protein
MTEQRLWYLANYDSLSGLPNRNLLYDRLDQALANAERSATAIGVMMLDLDGFKQVNDTLGHAAGDELLSQWSKRIARIMRKTDTLARLGGDEFCAVVANLSDPTHAAVIAEHVLCAMHYPFRIQGREVRIGTSIGIATSHTDGSNKESLLRAADQAMYRAKRAGKNTYVFYTQPVSGHGVQRVQHS